MGVVRDMTLHRIRAGQASKVVLARDIEARTDGPIDPRWPLRLARWPATVPAGIT